MDLNDIKSKASQIKAPQGRPGDQVGKSATLDSLVEQLRTADERERVGIVKAITLFGFAAVLLALSFIIPTWLAPTWEILSTTWFRGFLAAWMALLVLLGLISSRRLKAIDYAAPTRQFLSEAQRRYCWKRFWNYLVEIPACLLVGVLAGYYIVNVLPGRYFGPEARPVIIACFCVFFVGVCVMGYVFTYLNWKRDKKPLWLKIKQAQGELGSDEKA